MKSIAFKDKKYSIPENWSEVSFSQYQELMKVQSLDLGKTQQAAKIVSIISSIPYAEIGNASLSDYAGLMQNCKMEFLNQPCQSAPVTAFTINNQTFLVNSLTDSKFKEYAWFEKYDSDFEMPVDAVPYKLAVMCRLEGEDLDSVNIDERAAMFLKLDAVTVVGVSAFFLNSQKQSEQRFLLFSRLHQMRQNLKTQLTLLLGKNTAGLTQLTVLQKIYLKCLLYLI